MFGSHVTCSSVQREVQQWKKKMACSMDGRVGQYEVCVVVHEARHLAWPCMDPVVVVQISECKKHTASRESTDHPYYNEYFVFEFETTLEELMDKVITLSVEQARLVFQQRKVLGSVSLDVATVWMQPDHQFYHKWAPLTDPDITGASPRGYIKCDVSVVGKGDTVKVPVKEDDNYDDIEGNLLVPDSAKQGRQQALYIFQVYRADGLPFGQQCSIKKALTGTHRDLPDPYLQVSFAGLTGKTSIKKRTSAPVWDEQLVFCDMFPPLGQRIKLQLYDRSAVIATHYINLKNISSDGHRGFLPTFGPSFIQLYQICREQEHHNPHDTKSASYCGRILLALTISCNNSHSLNTPPFQRGVTLEPAKPLNESLLWQYEEMLLLGVLFSATMLDLRLTDSALHVEMSLGNAGNTTPGIALHVNLQHPNFDAPADPVMPACRSCSPPMKAKHFPNYCSLPLGADKPCMFVRSVWPDFCHRLRHSNRIAQMTECLEADLQQVQQSVQAHAVEVAQKINTALLHLIERCKTYIACAANYMEDCTDLDVEHIRICHQEVASIKDEAKACVKNLASTSPQNTLQEAKDFLKRLQLLIEDPQHALPDVFLWLMKGNKRIAFHTVPARKIFHSEIKEESGEGCGHVHSLLMKVPNKKSTGSAGWRILGKLDMYLWLGMTRHGATYLRMLPPGFQTPKPKAEEETDNTHIVIPTHIHYMEKLYFHGKVYIYQAHIMPGTDRGGLSDPFVTVTINEYSQSTQVLYETLNPTWDQMLFFPNIMIYGSSVNFVQNNPPVILLELMDKDKWSKPELVGQATIRPQVNPQSQKHVRLSWTAVFQKQEKRGEILAACELIQVTEESDIESHGPVLSIPRQIKPTMAGYRLEVLFWGVRDMKRTCLVTVDRPRVTMEVGSALLHSSVLQGTQQSLNFNTPHKYIDLELPKELEYCPSITLKVAESHSFGRFTHIGCNILRDIHKYICHLREKEKHTTHQHLLSFHRYSVRGKKTSGYDDMNTGDQHVNKIRSKIYSNILGVFSQRKKNVEQSLLASRRNRLSLQQNRSVQGDEEEDAVKYDWWTKYYEAVGLEQRSSNSNAGGILYTRHCYLPAQSHSTVSEQQMLQQKATLVIYDEELEVQPQFHSFCDWLVTFDIYRGKWVNEGDFNNANTVGKFKGAIKLYLWPPPEGHDLCTPTGHDPTKGVLHGHPSNNPMHVMVRVYIIKGISLHPRDYTGKSDPYIIVQTASTRVSNREDYIPNQVNPMFGRCFELEAIFPYDYLLTVRIMDWDLAKADDLIGETKIDIENRFYSWHRATCGIASKYDEIGYNAWRDPCKPTEILQDLCTKFNVDGPHYFGDSVEVGSNYFEITETNTRHTDVLQEELALEVLHHWQEVPHVGCHIVPEHVETRALYDPNKPGIEQGKLHMWVDIFPKTSTPLPPPVDISCRKPLPFELRCIICNTKDIILTEDDFFLDEKVSDIYVRGWLLDPDESQCTDVHYRSLSGEGNFNWRFIFPFSFLSAENKVVITKKQTLFDLHETEMKIPCCLNLQVWDNDHFSPDDFLGTLSLNLTKMPRGAKTASKCDLAVTSIEAPTINLFKIRRTKGWWPFQDIVDKTTILVGKLEMELQLLTQEEATANPAGTGRSAPDALEKPKRPGHSFSILWSPLHALYYLACHRYKWKLLRILFLVLLALFVLKSLYSTPEIAIKKLLKA